ncbi:hypothetical protein ACEF14_10160 [Weissella paramesenteroides]
MSKIDNYVATRGQIDPAFAKLVEQENINLEVAVKLCDLHKQIGSK